MEKQAFPIAETKRFNFFVKVKQLGVEKMERGVWESEGLGK